MKLTNLATSSPFSLVHKQYWGGTSVEEICKCKKEDVKSETFGEDLFCEDDFSDDGRSLYVTARTQMKFCEPLESLYYRFNETCEEKDFSLSVRTAFLLDKVKNITATLHCPIPPEQRFYWKHLKNRQLGYSDSENDKLFESVDHFKHESE